MTEIARMMGVSRQRVAQLVASYDDFPAPEAELSSGRIWSRTAVETWIASHPDRKGGRPEKPDVARLRRFSKGWKVTNPFQRFVPQARTVIAKAQEEARLMNHNYIGTEHLLLGLFAPPLSISLQVLSDLGVSVDTCREHLLEMIGPGDDDPTGPIPFTPRSKKVLELSLREALQTGDNFIGTEHLLLAVVRESDGVAWQILAKCGLTQSEVREAVDAARDETDVLDPLAEAVAKRPHMYPDIMRRVEVLEAKIEDLTEKLEG
jgi:hypothetical protein